MKLLTFSNPKTQKGVPFGYLTAILHLAPSNLSGYDVCPKASKQCRAVCLNTAGRGGIIKRGETTNRIQECRIRRTRLFFENRDVFFRHIRLDIIELMIKAHAAGLTPAVRLNGTSDICWEQERSPVLRGMTLMEYFSEVQFYDYTKIPNRNIPENYHLTFSLSEDNTAEAVSELDKGRNVAVVFQTVPTMFANRTVVNGDESDLRFLDKQGVVIGLKAKGKAKKLTSGFVK